MHLQNITKINFYWNESMRVISPRNESLLLQNFYFWSSILKVSVVKVMNFLVKSRLLPFIFGKVLKNFWIKCQPLHYYSVSWIFYIKRGRYTIYATFFIQINWILKTHFLKKSDAWPYLLQCSNNWEFSNAEIALPGIWKRLFWKTSADIYWYRVFNLKEQWSLW